MSSLVQLLTAGLAILLLALLRRRRQLQAPLPPGPHADFLLGHARVFPRKNIQSSLAQLAKQYGDVMQFSIFGQSLIVLSSQEATSNLLEKRGNIYSSRPRIPVFELTGWSPQHAFLPYGKEFIRSQKWWHSALSAKQSATYQPIQLKHARALVQNLLAAPDNIRTLLTQYTASVVVEVAYGPDMVQDSKIERIIQLLQDISERQAAIGDTSFLDLMPFLIHLPSWIPGLGCLAVARDIWHLQHEVEHMPFEELRRRMAAGQAYPALIASHLEALEREDRINDQELTNLRLHAAAIVGAGSETTWATIMNFIAAMLKFPDAQRKTREEINRTIGRDRLPEFSDRKSLPYLQSVIYESMRWQPPVPFAIPHLTTEDDVYNGMFIPKGSKVIANALAIVNDETVYKNPEQFLPERFLPERKEPIPTNTTYGHGRRICPGRHLADASVWIVSASLLTMFEIRPTLDSDGNEVKPDITFTNAFTSHPKPFRYRLIPRNAEIASLL